MPTSMPVGRAEQSTGADRANGSFWHAGVAHGAAAHRGRSASYKEQEGLSCDWPE
jgi:hypothetical protein